MLELRPYQVELIDDCVKTLHRYKLVYLAAQTRTGKTFMSLFAAKEYNAKHILFLTKKKALKSIEHDYNLGEFTFKLELLSVDSAHKASGNHDFVIMDEAHCIGSFPKASKRAKTIKPLVGDLPCMLLSATPSPESFSQLYHQFGISNHSPWSSHKNFYSWAREYVKVTHKRISGLMIRDYSKTFDKKVLIDKKHYMIDISQKEAGFKAKIDERFLNVKMKDGTCNLFRAIMDCGIASNDFMIVLGDTAAKRKSKCHQLASGTVISEQGPFLLDLSKANAIKDDMSTSGHSKAVIFYKFKAELELIKIAFKTENYDVTDDPEEFEKRDNVIFTSQFLSGREGIKLASSSILYVYNIDYAWLSYEQTKNRIMSFEKGENPQLVFVFSDLDIEKKIYTVVKSKKKYTALHFKKDFRDMMTDI